MSIQPTQLRQLIREVTMYLGFYSEEAVELLMLTAAVETHCGSYIKQVGGPALGIFQCEPATEQDIWSNYLCYHGNLESAVLQIMLTAEHDHVDWDLKANLVYQIAMARIHYLRVAERIPPAHDVWALAAYWKQYYNTPKGKGTTNKAFHKYQKYAGRER